MAYLNQVNLIGNIGGDPEIKNFESFKLATFKVATTERFRDRDGNQKEITHWHSCSATGSVADVVEKYIKKGMQVYVGGKLTYRNWTAKDGSNHTSTEVQVHTVQMLDRKPAGRQAKVVDEDLPDFLQ